MANATKQDGIVKINAKLAGNRMLHLLPFVDRSKKFAELYAKKSQYYAAKNPVAESKEDGYEGQPCLKSAIDYYQDIYDNSASAKCIYDELSILSRMDASDDRSFIKGLYDSLYHRFRLSYEFVQKLKQELNYRMEHGQEVPADGCGGTMRIGQDEAKNSYFTLCVLESLRDAMRQEESDPGAAFAIIKGQIEPKLSGAYRFGSNSFDKIFNDYMVDCVCKAYYSIAAHEKNRTVRIDEHTYQPATDDKLVRRIYGGIGDFILSMKHDRCNEPGCSFKDVFELVLPAYKKAHWHLREVEREKFYAKKLSHVLDVLESRKTKPTPEEYGQLLSWAQENCGVKAGEVSGRIFRAVENLQLSAYMGVKQS